MTKTLLSDQQLNQLREVCKAETRVLAVFLFGSQLDGYVTAHSDIDLAVLFEEDVDLSERLTLEAELCQALQREDVDLMVLNNAPISLRFRAISGRLLYECKPDVVSNFMQRTMVEYYDYQYRLETYQREFAKSLERDYDL